MAAHVHSPQANWAPAGLEGAVADPVNGAVPLRSNWDRQVTDTLKASDRALDRSRRSGDYALRQVRFLGEDLV